MVVRRKRKSRYMRGSRTHGYGSIGQHRKSGSRGGKGAAGLHKHKWSWIVKYFPDWFGKHGFTRPVTLRAEVRSINVGELDEIIGELKLRGELKSEGDTYVIDLSALGINKLLGRGHVKEKIKVVVYAATEKAINKIREAGGEVVVLSRSSTKE
ncbi:MAG: uL15 family ribosomal protein [Desulfurococcales archaeon]|nr:uL15 family ribosomal protein [Desulfurococcales archaeon]